MSLQFVRYCINKRVRSSGVAKDLVSQMKSLRRLGLMRATLQHFLVQSTFAVVRQDGGRICRFAIYNFLTHLASTSPVRGAKIGFVPQRTAIVNRNRVNA
jgi:hypothetical protein